MKKSKLSPNNREYIQTIVKLREQGVLSDSEFQKLKQKLL
jgi:hypothetical protein